MDPELLIPIISVLAVFGAPVAIIYVLRHFRLMERELNLEAGVDQNESYKKLEARLERIERLLTSIQSEVRALPPGPTGPAQLPPARREEAKD
jgi:hypothetical protein